MRATLLACHVTGVALPRYAPAFDLRRYDDPAYRALLDTWGDSGQLRVACQAGRALS